MSIEIKNGGIVVFTLMFLIMFAAKVFGAIDFCPWWLVFSPLWLPLLLFGLVVLILRGIAELLDAIQIQYMKSKETKNSRIRIYQIALFILMFLIMFTAKVCGAVDWSWWLIFSPVGSLVLIYISLAFLEELS